MICAELLGLKKTENVGKDPQAEARTAQYYKKRPCAAMVETAATLFAEYLSNKQ